MSVLGCCQLGYVIINSKLMVNDQQGGGGVRNNFFICPLGSIVLHKKKSEVACV